MGLFKRLIGKKTAKKSLAKSAPTPSSPHSREFPFQTLQDLTRKIGSGQNFLPQIEETLSGLMEDDRFSLQLAYALSNLGKVLMERHDRYPEEGKRSTSLDRSLSKDEIREKAQSFFEQAGKCFEIVWDMPEEKWDQPQKTTRSSFAQEVSTQTLSAYLKANSLCAYGFALKATQWWMISGVGQKGENRNRYFSRALEIIDMTLSFAEDKMAAFLANQREKIQRATVALESAADIYEIIGFAPDQVVQTIQGFDKLIAELEQQENWGLAGNLSANMGNALSLYKTEDPDWNRKKGEIALECYKRAGENYRKQGEAEKELHLDNSALARFNQAKWSFKKSGETQLASEMEQLMPA